MDHLAEELLPVARFLTVGMFALVACVAVVRARRGGPAGWPAAVAFGALGAALLSGAIEDAVGASFPAWIGVVSTLLLLSFPFLLVRFMARFVDPPAWLRVGARAAWIVVLALTLVMLPALRADEPPRGMGAFIAVVLAYWLALSAATVIRLWAAGTGQPTVPRRRMRLMSAATASLATAMLLAVATREGSPVLDLFVQLAAIGSAAAFAVGLYPPRALRLTWRQSDSHELQRATAEVLRAATRAEVAEALLPAAARVLGGRGAALVDRQGRVIAAHGETPHPGQPATANAQVAGQPATFEAAALGQDLGELVVWTSAYAPFFAREEVGLLHTMAAVAALALERADLLAEERGQRAAVEAARQEAVAAHKEANSANRAKSEFLSRMSHELRTPLNAILGFGQLLETSTLDSSDAEGVDYILKGGRHLLALINDVLDLSRVEAGMLTISLEPVDVLDLINDTVKLIQPLADARSIRLSVLADGCDVFVKTDRQRARQVLLNLLSNAVKYNRDGGEVDVLCRAGDGGTLRILVRDTGPGIDPARFDQLFQPFERLGAENSSVEGTGLGLALTRQLMERLGGQIGVDSAPRQGSTFWIDLPVTAATSGEDVSRPAPVPVPSGAATTTLLLIEDNLVNVRLVEAMLRRRPGISVMAAMQGSLAIQLATLHHPDVIVLDLHLPDIPGREVLHRLVADPQTRDIPVIVASADASPNRISQLHDEGAFDFITKPLDLDHFLRSVDAALARRDAGIQAPTT